MKFYSYILAMKKETLFILALMIWGIWMLVRTFFGWSNDEPQIIKDEWVWLIEEIEKNPDGNTGITSTGTQESTKTETTQKKNWYTEIRLMMPHYFYTAWWKNFAQHLYNDKNLYIKFTFIDNLNEYRDKISESDFSDADIILFPYDRISLVSTNSFSFQSNIESSFDNLLSHLVRDSELSFLPFAADPMIMYTVETYTWDSSFNNISEFTYNRTSKKPLSFPLFFGITDDDYDNEWFIREYQDIVRYALMHYFSTYRDKISLWTRIDSNVFEKYNTQNLNTLITAISSSKCKDFPAICLQLYNLVWIRFWFLSDYDIIKQYFMEKKWEFSKTQKYTMPFFSIESPVRLRWFAIPSSLKDANTTEWVHLFLSQYMREHDSYPLRSSTLSVFAWSNNSPLINNEFIWNRWYILKNWWNYVENLKNTKYFRELIEYKLSATDYIKKNPSLLDN